MSRLKSETAWFMATAIAPGSSDELRSMSKQYTLYTRVFPLLNSVSKLDHLLCVPAMYCLYYGLKTILRNTTATDGKGADA